MRRLGRTIKIYMFGGSRGVRKWLREQPKAELHLHLEGAVKFETVIELARENNIQLPYCSAENMKKKCGFRGFNDFADMYLEIVSAIKKPKDFERLAFELGQRLKNDGTVYAEVTWTPQLHVTDEHPFEDWLAAANKGRQRAEEALGVTMRWILDICRDRETTRMQVVKWATSDAARQGGVVALGLGGTETEFPAYRFIDAFKAAREAGLPVVPHAGEHKGKFAGPSSIWGAIDALGANRIGHGNRAIEEEELLEYLRDKRIPLEICPTSNIKFGLYKSMSDHPVKKLVKAGCLVTINTDDPEIFSTSLTDEFLKTAKALKLSFGELNRLIGNAFSVAFDPAAANAAREKARSEIPATGGADGTQSVVFLRESRPQECYEKRAQLAGAAKGESVSNSYGASGRFGATRASRVGGRANPT